MKYVTVAEMQAIEREANAAGLSYKAMMENAGRGLADLIQDDYDYLSAEGVLGLVGSGNNGGDTLVALSALEAQGWKATAVLLRPRQNDDQLVARLVNAGGKVINFVDETNYSPLEGFIKEHAVLLDGILGTGTKLPLRADLSAKMDFIRKTIAESDSPPIVIAVDCPSGIDCDNGEAAPECLPAVRTITMAAVKQGLCKFPAYELVGDLSLVDIGLPDGGEGLKAWRDISTFVPDVAWIRNNLLERPLNAHKGTFGTALIAAGSSSYTGASILAGEAAYRSGAGLVTLAIPENLHNALAGHFPEATWLLLPEENGNIASDAAPVILNNLDRVTALLCGCGLGLAETTAKFIARLIDHPGLPPMVVDADGLKLLSQQKSWAQKLPAFTVLTPHPGEMSILTGMAIGDIQSNRLEAARKFSKEWGHVVVLKGAFTVIASPEGMEAVIPVASPALARAGTGDVLAGVITGLRAQGIPAFQSAVLGAWIHAHAGLKAAEIMGGSASVLAGDVLNSISEVLAEVS